MLFIYNPHAGKELIRKKLSYFIEEFNRCGYEVTVYATQKRNDATEIVRKRGAEFDRIVCAGGDGTMHETMVGIMQLSPEQRCPCGYLPAGTVNDFAHTIGIPKKIEAAVTIAEKGRPFSYDVGSMNDKFFNYIVAFGAFTSVSYETPQSTKNLLGKGAYFLEGLMKLPSIKPYHAVITAGDGTKAEGDFIFGMVTNSTSVGGFPLFRKSRVSLNDGMFEGVFVKNPKNPIEFQAVIAAFMSASANDQIITMCSESFTIQSDDRVAYTIDGENGGEHRTAVIQNHHRAITYLCQN